MPTNSRFDTTHSPNAACDIRWQTPVNSLQDMLLSQCSLTDQVFSGPFELLQSIRCRNSQLSLTTPGNLTRPSPHAPGPAAYR
jgi:hypothetical protein